MFICSTAAWKDFSHLLWVDIAYQNFISGADLCEQAVPCQGLLCVCTQVSHLQFFRSNSLSDFI